MPLLSTGPSHNRKNLLPFVYLVPIFFLAFCGINQSAHAINLSVTEQEIITAVKEHSSEALDLLEKSVKINSGTMNEAGVRDVGQLFRIQFDQLGFSTDWVEMPPAMHRAGHLVAEREGKQGKRLLLIGHLDTVFEKDSPTPLWIRRENKIWGQGVIDMKGGNVVIVSALRALQKVGVLKDTRILVVLSGDEEQVGSPLHIARAALINAAKRSEVALAFESMMQDANGNDAGTVGRRAIGSFSLKVSGKQGHSSRIFGAGGDGAIYEAARILTKFREQLVEPGLTFNVGTILGGTEVVYDKQTKKGDVFGKFNVIPKVTVAEGDLRYLTHEQRDHTYARMNEIVAQHLHGTKADIHFHEIYPPMAPTPGNMKLLDIFSKASSDAGLGTINPISPSLRGAGDVQFVAPYVDSLDGLGTAGGGDHSPDEFMDLPSLERATIRAALMIFRLTR
ncbi:MAG: family peptidase [Solimicrobium sp.]|jgi:glutamate carboxypeptidase|nr:family peptidase [Solimicrobium sp.]